MFEIKMMNGDIIEISQEKARALVNKSGLVAITDIGIINLNSVVSVLPKGLVKNIKDTKERKLHDGSTAILKFGQWVDSYSGATLDKSYYPELTKDIELTPLIENK